MSSGDSKPVKDLKGQKVMVIHEYKAVNPDELNLTPGQVIDVMEEDCEGWWRGVVEGRKGVFPDNFVELIPQYSKPPESSANHTESEIRGRRAVVFYAYQAQDVDELHLNPGQIVDVLGEECDGWWKGVLVEETKLKEGKEGVFPDNFVELLPQTPHGPLDDAELKDRKAIVYFGYEAANPDELSIKPGQVVNILGTGDEGWWKGELEGKEGVLPDNFVQLIPLYKPSTAKDLEKIQFKKRKDFSTDMEYGRYVKTTLKPGMRVRARQNVGPVFQGESGLYFQHTYSVAGPALFVWDESRKAQRAHWIDVEIVSREPDSGSTGEAKNDSASTGESKNSSISTRGSKNDSSSTGESKNENQHRLHVPSDQIDGKNGLRMKLQCHRAQCDAEQAKLDAQEAKKEALEARKKAQVAEAKAERVLLVEKRVLEADRKAQLAELRAEDAERMAEKAIQEAQTKFEQAMRRVEAAERRVTSIEETLTRRLQELERTLQAAQTDPQEKPFWVVQREEIQMTTEEIGRGGWGAIKVALFRGQRVAAKTLHNQIISPHNLCLFTREMNMAARVRHPNLLQFIGATTEGEPIILTELMHTSLRIVLASTLLSWSQMKSIFSDVVRALNYLHLMQPTSVIHRDISSANILLEPSSTTTWKAKVSDFGSTNFVSHVATTGPGNPLYAAPEAFNPYQQTPKMDIFSFGILLLETCTSQLPPVDEREELIGQIRWPAVVPLVRRCIDEDKDRRPTAQDILRELDSLSGLR